MVHFNRNDLIQLKYLLISTGFVTKADVIDIKDADEVFKKLETNLQNIACDELYESVRNDSFRKLKFFNLLHQNAFCPSSINDGTNSFFSEPARMMADLYENLENEQFVAILRDFFCVSEQQYYDLELDTCEIKCEEYLPKIRDWLKKNNNSYSDNIEDLMKKRAGDFDSSNLIDNLDVLNLTVSPETPVVETGICLVISNENFKNYKQRKGTTEDEKTINETFKKLGYKVIVKQNVTFHHLFRILEDIKSDIKPDHKRLIIFLLSHGKKQILISSDDKEVPFEKIIDCFKVSRCINLARKSKLFFFVCCQGDETNRAIQVDSFSTNSDVLEEDSPPKKLAPDVSDLFIGYATYKSHVAFRDTNNGTLYIRKLCEKINQYPKKKISDIHQEIQYDIAENPISGQDCFQVPYYENAICNGDLYLY